MILQVSKVIYLAASKRRIMEKHITVPFSSEEAASLTAGDLVYLTGTVYTARDAAHKRMIDTLDAGKPLPIDIEGSVIYYMGPSPAREGRVIGSAGPTTSSRMDKYTPTLLELGLAGMIGKGKRSPLVKESMIQNGAVYFAAVGGAGALLSRSIIVSQPVAYEDLGTEAIRKLYIRDFPAIVVIDSLGHDLYESNPQQYEKEAIL
jgi:fumarate hydratase subunit beta